MAISKKDILNGILADYETRISALTEGDAFAQAEAAIDYCKKELEQLEKQAARNDKRRADKAAENQEYFDKLLESLAESEEGLTASDGAALLGVSVQKASSLFRSLVADGKANQTDKKIPKKGSCKVYTVA